MDYERLAQPVSHLMMRRGRKIAKVAMARKLGPFVLDDAPGTELSAVEQVRFARGTARKSPWCA